jgi:hypothetical protein
VRFCKGWDQAFVALLFYAATGILAQAQTRPNRPPRWRSTLYWPSIAATPGMP